MIIIKIILFISFLKISYGSNKLVQYVLIKDQGLTEDYSNINILIPKYIASHSLMCQIACNLNNYCQLITFDKNNGCTLFKGFIEPNNMNPSENTTIYKKITKNGKNCVSDSDCLECKGFACRSGTCQCKGYLTYFF